MKKIIITIIAIFIIAISLLYANRDNVRDFLFEVQKSEIPEPVSRQEAKRLLVIEGEIETVDIIGIEADLQLPPKSEDKKDEPITEVTEPKIPEEINLDIPFTSQAPFALWDEIHQDTCEEASVLMAARFVNGLTISSPADADRDILKMVDWQKQYFGFWKDTDVAKTADILRQYYGLKDVEVKYDITIDDIKAEVAKGNPVIIPAAGRLLGNPYYTPPGPYYHMLVVKGYTKTKIITNDPGTKRGEDFAYDANIFYEAIHDWNNGDVANGRKAMIIVK